MVACCACRKEWKNLEEVCKSIDKEELKLLDYYVLKNTAIIKFHHSEKGNGRFCFSIVYLEIGGEF